MTKPPPAEESEEVVMWTTWEELLLTCAVKRHGLKDWESVAMELQNRSSQPPVLTAQICRNKYNDLKRRFIDDRDGAPAAGDGDGIPWLEELRKLRVAELKQEVHRHDLSIQSLQLKVKRLEEEREQKLNENEDEKPDLENNNENERSDTDKDAGTLAPAPEPENVTGKSVSGEYSDRDSRTLNESNSAENRDKTGKAEPEPVQTGPVQQDPEPEAKPVAEDSCNDSSDTVAKNAASKPSLEKKMEAESNESKERTNKDASDVQSSASLTKKIRRRGVVVGGGGEKDGGGVGGATTVKRESVKSEPLVGFLDIFRSHKHGSMFERRLDIQKTDKYKNTVRQHVDFETIQTRIEDGSYSSCPTKFYSDLLLLFNNATVFFPKDSDESAAAVELRNLVLKEIRRKRIGRPSPETAKIQPKPDPEKPDPLLSKHKPSSVPIIVCRKRSSIATKPGSSSKQPEEKAVTKPKPDSKTELKPVSKNSNEEDSSTIKLKAKEKPVTGVRSMRRSSNNNSNSNSNNNRTVNTTTSSKGQGSNLGGSGKEGAPAKGEKKKEVAAVVAAKKSGAADFLKRIKRISPAKGSVEESGGGSRREQQKKRGVVEEKKEVAPVKKKGGGGSGGGGDGGKQGKEDSSPSKRNVGRPPKRGAEPVVSAKRGREVDGGGRGGGEGEGGSNTKRPKKRTRR